MIASLDTLPDQALKDYYTILNINKNANRQQIKDAFFKMKNIYSDSNQALYSIVSNEDMNFTLNEIEEAYRILSQTEKRTEYNKALLECGMADPSDFEIEDSSQASHLKPHQAPASLAISDWPREDMNHIESSRDEITFINDPSHMQTAHRRLHAICANDLSTQEKIAELIAAHELGDGNLYRKIREVCDVTIAEMQEHIKVSIDYIKDIEQNRFERLPQAVYVKGFLKSYLRFLGVKQTDKFINAYITRLKDWMETGNH